VQWIGDVIAEKADAFVTANVLAAAIRKNEPYDVIICGEGSADAYSQQIAPRLATLLGIPAITFVQQLTMEDGRVIATRKLGDCTEVVEVQGCAVISVLPEINKPRIPSLKQVMAAAKKPSEELKITGLDLAGEELEAKTVSLAVKGYVMNRKNIVFKEASQADNVAKLVASLAQEGVG
jgi:electron transfer flavoprotein beta subunit